MKIRYFSLLAATILGGMLACSKNENQAQLVGVQVVDFGPKSALVGKKFNSQSNGDSALWFKAIGVGGNQTYTFRFGDRILKDIAIVQNQGGSVQIPVECIKKAGVYPLALIESPSGKEYALGTFEVLDPSQHIPDDPK